MSKASAFLLATACTLAVAPHSFGQAAPTASPQPKPAAAAAPTEAAPAEEISNDVVVMDPFVVDASKDQGYKVNNTLAGTRIRTEMKDIASSISVVNAEFLRDTGVKNQQELLVYTTNTEVGGPSGNFAGVGGTFIDGASDAGNLVRPNQNTRVRGLDSADNTRDFFLTDIPWDSYIVGRVDLQRGPNSILFGLGSPAGIVNSSINTATYRTAGSVEARFGSFNSFRTSLDYNHVLLEDELALRVSLLDDNNKFRQRPAYNHDKRVFGALRWDPKFLSSDNARTAFRANYEHGEVIANRPRTLPPEDRITPFFATNAINKKSWDPYYAWSAGIVSYSSSTTIAGVSKNFWVVQYPGPGIQATANAIFTYDNQGSATPISVRQAGPTTTYGLSTAGVRDGGIDGFPYGSNIGIAGFGEAANNDWRVNGNTNFPAADKRFWKNKSLTDTSIFDFYNNLLGGPNSKQWNNWDSFNVAATQSLFNNRVNAELVYDFQKYDDGQATNLNNPFISVDIRANLMDYPSQFTDLVKLNPNVGRAFVGSSTKGGNYASFTERENTRATVTGELFGSDFLDEKSFASRLVGKHVLTGLYSKETYDREERNWVRYALENKWSVKTAPANSGLANGDINIDWWTYLSSDLRSRSTAAGLNLGAISAVQSPKGSYQIDYYDSHWKATGVNPADPWFNPARSPGNTPPGEASSQSENPRNYVGWVSDSFAILNADDGDINRLYTDVNTSRRTTDSKAFTWQGYFWDGTVVGTWGWRRDTQKLRSGSSSANTDPSGIAQISPELGTGEVSATGDNISWGLVVHTPKQFRDKLPLGTHFSLTYSDGRNTRVENRYGFDGSTLPNSKGRTKDIGIVMSTLEDKLQFKASIYKTSVSNANLSSVTSEVSTLGNNTYYLRNLEAWGTATALAYLNGRAGGMVGNEWFWNWALVDGNTVPGASTFPGQWDGAYNDPNGTPFKTHPSTIKQTAAINSWLAQLQPEAWFKAYGFNINYAAAKAGNYQTAFPGWVADQNIGGVQPSGGGRIAGTWPTGTADNESKGVEFELIGQPTKNLNVSINASKTKASQTALGASLVSFIESQYAKYQTPAGDLRLWWAGGDAFRKTYTENIWSAYQFQLQTNGKMVAEMAPWRFNAVANYSFDEGILKGTNVGFGYRWQDGVILGYQLNAAKDNLDINKPFWGKSEDALDLWVGHERQITSKIKWRIQLNLRNVGDSSRLQAISIQPDGTGAGYRIVDGMSWSLTNSFYF